MVHNCNQIIAFILRPSSKMKSLFELRPWFDEDHEELGRTSKDQTERKAPTGKGKRISASPSAPRMGWASFNTNNLFCF